MRLYEGRAVEMYVSGRQLATMTTGGGIRPAPLALLPPIPLYRRLFRAHRHHLPANMRVLGDNYVKSEFRSHRDVDNPMHIVRMLCSCRAYMLLH